MGGLRPRVLMSQPPLLFRILYHLENTPGAPTSKRRASHAEDSRDVFSFFNIASSNLATLIYSISPYFIVHASTLVSEDTTFFILGLICLKPMLTRINP